MQISIENLPVALLQEYADPKMTDRYKVISTRSVIDIMQEQGYNVHSYKVDNARKVSRDFARHMVVFRPEVEVEVFGTVPQFLWTNSHNGRCAGKLRGGLYRFVCSNGLVIGNDVVSDRLLHNAKVKDQMINRITNLAKLSDISFQKIEAWSKIELNEDSRLHMAKEALNIRFGKSAGSYNPADLLVARRGEDEGYDLWRTFNRIQENAMKGGFAGRNANNRRVRARDVKGITQDISFNEGLWSIAEEIAYR